MLSSLETHSLPVQHVCCPIKDPFFPFPLSICLCCAHPQPALTSGPHLPVSLPAPSSPVASATPEGPVAFLTSSLRDSPGDHHSPAPLAPRGQAQEEAADRATLPTSILLSSINQASRAHFSKELLQHVDIFILIECASGDGTVGAHRLVWGEKLLFKEGTQQVI